MSILLHKKSGRVNGNVSGDQKLRNPLDAGKPGISFGIILSGIWLVFVLVFLLFPAIAGKDALFQDIMSGSLPAFSKGHILGTDMLGRDVLKLTIAGTRSALLGPIAIALGSIIIGIILGSIAGWFGGATDWIISRYADMTLSMPSLLLAIVAAGVIGGGYWVSVIVLIILYSPFDIRIVRSAVIAQKNMPYIEAALVLKLSTARILAKHIFPNITLVVLVNFFLNIAYGLMSMSALSYLGLGVSPAAADWGRQLADARDLLYKNPAAMLSTGLAIIFTAVAINVVGNRMAERNTIDVS